MAIKFTNNATATLASSINNVATSVVLSSGQGALFPSISGSDYYYVTLVDSSNNLEIVKVTARSTDTLTVVRGQDGTSARAFSAGDRCELRVVAASLQELVGQAATATTSTVGPVQLTDSISSTSTTTAATPNSVKTAYDLANAALPKSGGSMTGDITETKANPRFTLNNNNGTASSVQLGADSGSVFVGSITSTTLNLVTNNVTRGTIDTSGNLTMTGNVTANSDERFKTNWRHLQANFTTKLADVKYGVYDRTDSAMTQVGVSAQSLQALLPEAVLTDDEGKLSVAYGNAALVAAIELAKEVVALKKEIEEIKKGK